MAIIRSTGRERDHAAVLRELTGLVNRRDVCRSEIVARLVEVDSLHDAIERLLGELSRLKGGG